MTLSSGLQSSLANTQTCTYCRLPRPGAARFYRDGAEAVSKVSGCFVALGDHGRSFKGRGGFGGGLALYVMNMREINEKKTTKKTTVLQTVMMNKRNRMV